MNRIYFTLLLLLAQTLYSQEEIIEPYVGEVTESELILLADDISDLIESRFNINQATKEKLELLPFLSDNQIENILYYLYTSGPLLSI
ncbi:MAG: helix-hairpin-helix domain-containing protein, partial [Bacteroidales bacterium]